MTDLETLLRAVSDLRAEIRADMAGLRAEMAEARRSAVDRGEHAAQVAALDQRITALETARRGVLTGVVWPLLVGVMLTAVGVLGTLMATRGGG